MQKTLAMKFLEGKKVAYEVVSYSDTIRDAEEIAKLLDIPPGQVFKTLVVKAPEGARPLAKPLLIMIPADRQLDLKKLAKGVEAKKLKMANASGSRSDDRAASWRHFAPDIGESGISYFLG